MIAIVEAAGWPIWFLILTSVIAVGLIIERTGYLRSYRIAPPRCLTRSSMSSSSAVSVTACCPNLPATRHWGAFLPQDSKTSKALLK